VLDGGDECGDGGLVGDVDGLVEDFVAGFAGDFLRGFGEVRGSTGANGNAGAFTRKFGGDGTAQARTGGGNDGYAVCEAQVHN
jgi:hypothetical protein